jgi:vacuolar protein sorting-associated protein 16
MHYSYKVVEENVVLGGPLDGAIDSHLSNKENGNILPSTTTAKFVAAARKLKILNALRNPQVGFVLTSAQFDAITPLGVVARLIAQRRPSLATAICKYLSLPRSVQLFARAAKAAALVERPETSVGRSDAELAEAAIAIINQDDENENKDFRTTGPLSVSTATTTMNRGAYATVAMAASKAGRPGVANLLLLLETSVADKIPALVATGSFADAVAVATAANDGDFIFSTLLEYERTCMASAASASDVSKAQSAFYGTVVSKFTPETFHTLRQYLECISDVKTVANLLLRAQKFSQAGATLALRAMLEQDTREKQGMLSEASRVFGLGKETAFEKACTDDFLQLLKDQEVIRTKYGAYEAAPESSSVTSTIAAMLQFGAIHVREQHRLLSDADKLAKKYRIPERRLWYIKVKAFQDSGQWSNLRILADSRKTPPIGFKPFARAAIRGKQNVTEILRYLDRIAVPEERYDLYCEASLWKNALEEAIRMRDGRRVLNVKTLCNSQELQLECDQAMGRLA